VQRLATGDRAGVDLEPVALRPDPACEALPEAVAGGAHVTRRGLGRLGKRDTRGKLCVDSARARLGDDVLPVEERDHIAGALDRECPLERRRKPQRDLDLLGVDERRQPRGRVAAVCRSERAAEAVWDSDLDAAVLPSGGASRGAYGRFPTVRRKP
jgi:hypothetical protein